MKEFIAKYWLEVAFGLLCAFVGWLTKQIRSWVKENKALKDGTLCILRETIVQKAERYIDKQYCPLHCRDALEKSFVSYTNLGGNGSVVGLMEAVRNLPLHLSELNEEEI